jgi:hypothetical protein
MKPESRVTLYAGVNFVLAPMQPSLNKAGCLEFQQILDKYGITITKAVYSEKELNLIRERPDPLEIKIAIIGPQIGQLIIAAPQLGSRSLGVASAEAEDVVRAFEAAWQIPQRQILSCDATIRDLYNTDGQHAFQELWEGRLKQPADGLRTFGRAVLGGGLRFVMPAHESDPTIEVKIESFLQNTAKIFLETQFAWPIPQKPGAPMDPENRLTTVDNYIQKEVVNFIMER